MSTSEQEANEALTPPFFHGRPITLITGGSSGVGACSCGFVR